MVAFVLLISSAVCSADTPTPIVPAKLNRTAPIDYPADVAPILAAHCTTCHSGKQTEGNYDMGTLAGLIKGGKRGVAVVPGKPAESPFYSYSAHNAKPIMPPRSENDELSPQEVAILQAWIEQGAKGPAVMAKTRPVVSLTAPAERVRPVRGLAISANTIIASRGTQIRIYDAKSGSAIGSLLDPALKSAAHLSVVESMALRPDSKELATGSFREVKIWNLETKALIRTLTGFADRVVSLSYSPDGKSLAIGGGAPTEDGEIKIFDVANGQQIAEWKSPHSDTVFGVAYSADGKFLATAGADKFVRIFEASSGKLVKSFEGHTQQVLDVAWSPDGKRLASVSADDLIKVWDVEKGEKVRDLKGHTKQATRLVYNKSGIISIGGDGLVKMWRPDDGNATRSYGDSKDCLSSLAVNGDSSLIVTGSEEGMLRLYAGANGTTGKVIEP